MRGLALALAVTAAGAGDIRQVSVDRHGDLYRMEVDALVQAPASGVRARLTDYAHLDRLNGSIKSSELLPGTAPGEPRVRIVTRACVWFFCRTIEQVQSVRETRDGWIEARVIPELSDFKRGSARFSIHPEAGGTRVLILSEVEPDFWIPPVIGPWLIKRKLRSEVLETVSNLEAHARRAP